MKRFSLVLVFVLLGCGGDLETQSGAPASGSYQLTSLVCGGSYKVPLEGVFGQTVTFEADGTARIDSFTPATEPREGCLHRQDVNFQEQGEIITYSVVETECRDYLTNSGGDNCEIVFPLWGVVRMIQECGEGPTAGRFSISDDGVLTGTVKSTIGEISCNATYERN